MTNRHFQPQGQARGTSRHGPNGCAYAGRILPPSHPPGTAHPRNQSPQIMAKRVANLQDEVNKRAFFALVSGSGLRRRSRCYAKKPYENYGLAMYDADAHHGLQVLRRDLRYRPPIRSLEPSHLSPQQGLQAPTTRSATPSTRTNSGPHLLPARAGQGAW